MFYGSDKPSESGQNRAVPSAPGIRSSSNGAASRAVEHSSVFNA
jgi:hypothetical protein